MGDIYLATDDVLGREVAVKILSERHAADETIRQRFRREGLAAAQRSGEHGAVKVFDVGEWQGRPFLVLEHVGEGSLEDTLRQEGAQSPVRDSLSRSGGTTVQLVPPRRRGAPARLVLPATLLVLAAAVGAAIVAMVAGSGDGKPAAEVATRTVTGRGATTTAPAPPPPPAAGLDGHTLNDRGYQLMQRGDYTGALPLFQEAVRKLAGTGPGDLYEGYANYNLGYTLYRLGRCSEAVTYLRRAEQLEPGRHEPKNLRKRAERC